MARAVLKNANGELTPANPFSEYYDVIRKAYNEAILVDPEPIIVGVPEPHLYFDSYAAVRLTGGASLVAIARCRMFSIFASLAPWELAERLAVVSLVGKLERYKAGTYKLSKEDDYDRMIRQVAEKATRPPRIKSL